MLKPISRKKILTLSNHVIVIPFCALIQINSVSEID